MQQLYFVRHGESEDNAAKIWSRPESPLTALGRQQALQTAKAIREQGLHFDLVIVSTMPRAMETAQIIAQELGYDPSTFDANKLFIERSWGKLEGTSNADFLASGEAMRGLDGTPGSERLADLQARAARALEYVRARPETRILLVGHGSFARALRRVINGEPYTAEYVKNLARYHNGEVARLI